MRLFISFFLYLRQVQVLLRLFRGRVRVWADAASEVLNETILLRKVIETISKNANKIPGNVFINVFPLVKILPPRLSPDAVLGSNLITRRPIYIVYSLHSTAFYIL